MLEIEFSALLKTEAQAFLQQHLAEDPSSVALKYHGEKSLPIRAIAEQIRCIKKAKKKLPNFVREDMIFTEQSLEQCSSEQTALYKSRLMQGRRLIDLTGGLGVDTIFLAKSFESVTYVEQDAILAKLFRHNLEKIDAKNIAIVNEESLAHLQTYPNKFFDWLYIDPSRRKDGRRLYSLEDCSPNVLLHQNLLMAKAAQVCIKVSPLMDLTAIQKTVSNLKEIHVVSVDDECKEILIVLSDLQLGAAPVVKAVSLSRKQSVPSFELSAAASDAFEKKIVDELRPYFYVPDVALTKANLTPKLAAARGLYFINPAIDYLTADVFDKGFPGRVFQVERVLAFKKKGLRKQLVEAGYAAASLARRDFPYSPEELRKLLKLEESREAFLFFTKTNSKKLVCICCKKMSEAIESLSVEPFSESNMGK
ncbi:conserved hypothetical protein [Chloroherpeton thalassium ATCC 35110]|uniref:THUMP-like domain-containing protein n=1 Tax=Chloroherpeton thalassium (strain ATCC 35110 / GB-78) TaxID=517418 RepID=B3QVD7_CHLT3|nr:class I SAM-dependent methyltransferase [Chloroherpeton thalassium]ACF14537.1 conserved hypothetical protein [Chloroherpeton thalassium ATCC 35110]